MGDESEEQRRRRLEALQTLAANRAPAPVVSTATPKRAPRGGSWRRIGLAALVVAIVAGAGAFGWLRLHRAAGASETSARAVALTFPNGELACVEEAHWSPDGKRLAVFGQSNCQQDAKDGIVGIFASATGAAQATFELDPLVAAQAVPQTLDPAALKADATLPSQIPFTYYGLVGWSPDGQRLAIRIGVDTGAYRQIVGHKRVSSADYWFGMLTIDVATKEAHVALMPVGGTPGYSSPSSFQPLEFTRWDLTAGTATSLRMPQALSYVWTNGGILQPTALLPTTASAPPTPAPTGPIGQPLGGQSFTMWQVAQPQFDANFCSGSFFSMVLTTSAWSPDGRYIADNLHVVGRVDGSEIHAPPVTGNCIPTTAQGAPDDPQLLARLPMRDAALTAALTAYAQRTDRRQAQTAFAWDPNGARLAVVTDLTQFGSSAVAIYSTTNGHPLEQIDGKTVDPRYDISSPVPLDVSWSPDGTRLAVFDARRLILLDTHALGA